MSQCSPSRLGLGVVLEIYYRELVRFLSAKLGDRQVAADVAHDAYLRVMERASQAQIDSPRAFLYRTALNLVVDEHRRNNLRRSENLDVLDQDEQFFSPSPHRSLAQAQRLQLLQRALDELPTLCRDAFLLRKLEGLRHDEIAARLSISQSLVEKHIVNAMKHCRLRMREWDAE
ncbi:RNA polymerase sigma factor (sigma-70 family) [Pseudomonas sp. TE3786]